MRAADKTQLRRRFRDVRAALPEAEAARHAHAIRQALASLPEIERARTLYAFWPLVARGEIDLRPLLVAWHHEGKTIGLPRVEGVSPPRLAFHTWLPDDARVRGGFGVEEPALSAPLAPTPDAIVVPALAIDARGYRLGYGGGFYDALLATTRAFTVVPLLDRCLVDALPHELHDQRIDAVTTERRTVRFSPFSQP